MLHSVKDLQIINSYREHCSFNIPIQALHDEVHHLDDKMLDGASWYSAHLVFVYMRLNKWPHSVENYFLELFADPAGQSNPPSNPTLGGLRDSPRKSRASQK